MDLKLIIVVKKSNLVGKGFVVGQPEHMAVVGCTQQLAGCSQMSAVAFGIVASGTAVVA